MANRNLPHLFSNWISVAGAVIAIVITIIILIILGADFITGTSNLYLGILAYMVMPPFLIFGLVLIPVGMYRKWRHLKKTGEVPLQRYPLIDLNNRSHRRAALIFVAGTALFVAMSAYGAYEGYHYSESVAFCGTLCHTVMEPEYITYQHSPHARVRCTACHVGPGAGWYTKSKLSGAYQIYATVADIYPRPIPTPIKNLRPARQTCEQCHWPEKFYGSQQQQFDHYLYDDQNTRWSINMLLKTGGGDPEKRLIQGIHWHVSSNFQIEYIAADKGRQDIPWVKMTDKHTGEVTIFQNSDKPLTKQEISQSQTRIMDCVDCHNRPSHIFRSPDYAVDQYITDGEIPSSMPQIKQIAVKSLAAKYKSSDSALAEIAGRISEFYQKKYPDFHSQNPSLIDSVSTMIQELYSLYFFPEMKTSWSDYPDNIGHFTDIGCMRCHEGKHVSEDRKVIPHKCTACHIILSQGKDEQSLVSMSAAGLEFTHPVGIDQIWREIGCFECHNGVQP